MMVCVLGFAPPGVYVPKGRLGGFADKVNWLPIVTVAVTVGLGETPAALNVRMQVCGPGVEFAVLIDALIFASVDPERVGKDSHAQSLPVEMLNGRPVKGPVLLT